MPRASNDTFDELHELTARTILNMLSAAADNRLSNGERDKDGKLILVMPPPALLAQAIKFLKDNGIDRPASSMKKTDTLKDAMPDFDAIEGNVVPLRK